MLKQVDRRQINREANGREFIRKVNRQRLREWRKYRKYIKGR